MNALASRPGLRFQLVADGCAVASIAIGLSVMTAWLFPLAWYQSLSPFFQRMAFNSALCSALTGAALWSRNRATLRILLGLMVALIGALTLTTHITGLDFGIDQFFVVDSLPKNFPPGRMLPSTALCYLLLGLSASTLGRVRGSLGFGFAEPFAFAVLVISSLGYSPHLGGNRLFYTFPGVDKMAPQTVFALFLLSIGLICTVRQGAIVPEKHFSKTSRLLGLGFSTLTLVLLILGIAASGRMRVISEHLDGLSKAHLRSAATHELEVKVLEYVLDLRVCLAGDAPALSRAATHAQSITRHLDSYNQLTTSPQQRELASRFLVQWDELHAFGLQLGAAGFAAQEDSQHLVQLRTSLLQFVNHELQTDALAEFESQKRGIVESVAASANLTLLLLIIGIATAVTTSVFITRSILRSEEKLAVGAIALENAKLNAEKANLAKSDFLSSMSHELRSPLHAILGFAQLIKADPAPPTPSQKESLNHILDAGWHLLELINEILDLSQIESGKLVLSIETVSLAEVLRECRMMTEPQARQRGTNIDIPDFANPCYVEADHIRIKQVIINLFTNAIKYGGDNGSVVVERHALSPGHTRVSVRDSGAGLSLDKIQQLFQPFNRLGQDSGTEEGTGIGLVVSKRLIEAMGGKMGVESTLGVGSVFWFELNTAGAPEQKLLSRQPEDLALLPKGSKLRTLLYVEDNPANLEMVRQLLSRRPDFRMLSAAKATIGVELARSHQPDLILMDINLPVINGFEALKMLRSDGATAHIPVIALSANAMPHDVELGMNAGFFHYLTKPIQLKKLMDTIEAALDSRNYLS